MSKSDKAAAHTFVRRSALEEFNDFTTRELERLRHSDQPFDEARYAEAIDLVVSKIQRQQDRGQ